VLLEVIGCHCGLLFFLGAGHLGTAAGTTAWRVLKRTAKTLSVNVAAAPKVSGIYQRFSKQIRLRLNILRISESCGFHSHSTGQATTSGWHPRGNHHLLFERLTPERCREPRRTEPELGYTNEQ
jgi:hypothetical protein